MFRRAAHLLNSVADVIDEMLASDFEFEVEDQIALDAAWAEAEAHRFERYELISCDAEGRRRRSPGDASGTIVRRPGSVPRPAEFCLTPLDAQHPRRADGDADAPSVR